MHNTHVHIASTDKYPFTVFSKPLNIGTGDPKDKLSKTDNYFYFKNTKFSQPVDILADD